MSKDATPVRSFNARMDPGLHEAIRRHAFERNVSMSQLLNDIMRVWVLAATDPRDPQFSPRALPLGLPEPPHEHYPGYLDSLVFTVAAPEE
jgi:hypothetical protein